MAVTIKKGNALDGLGITPLIDVVFLLLIFFLVATRFAEEDRELDVPLPTASEAKPMMDQPKEIFININQRGQYFVEGKVMGPDEVETMLQQAVANNPLTQSVVIRADKRVQLQHAVSAMNLCQKVGVSHILATDEESN